MSDNTTREMSITRVLHDLWFSDLKVQAFSCAQGINTGISISFVAGDDNVQACGQKSSALNRTLLLPVEAAGDLVELLGEALDMFNED